MKEAEKRAILKLVEDAEKDNFFGEITLRFRDGKVYQIFKGQSILLEQLTEQS